MSQQLILYLPVIHAGYERFLTSHADSDEVLVLGAGFDAIFASLQKEIRALRPERAAELARILLPGVPVRVIEPAALATSITAGAVVVPDEQIMRELVEQFGLAEGRTVRYERTFLRWERSWSLAQRPVNYAGKVAADELSRHFMSRAGDAAARSSDWWRQVGAVAVRDGAVLSIRHNRHLPTEYAPYLDGDPRNDFHRGVRNDLSTAIHAEADLIAQAAGDGLALSGADIYVSTFPCPSCARLIAAARFRRCYFAGPYAMLDGEHILQSAGVEPIWVDLSDDDDEVQPRTD